MDALHSTEMGRTPGSLVANFGYNASIDIGPGPGDGPNTTLDPLWGVTSTPEDSITSIFAIVLACLTIPVVLVGSIANVTVLYIVLRYKNMHNVINYSFANLALADLLGLVLDAVPSIALSIENQTLTDPGCRLLLYLPWTIRQAACLTLAYLAFDRYRLIIHPTSSTRSRSPTTVLTVLVVIWLVSGIVQIPTAVLTGLNEKGQCKEYRLTNGGTWYYWAKVISIYIIPLAVISVSYFKIWCRLNVPVNAGGGRSRGSIKMRTFRKRSARRILIIVVIFAITWVPIFVIHLWPHYGDPSSETSRRYVIVHDLTNFLLYISMMLNPFLYAFAGDGFRKHFSRFSAGTNNLSSVDIDLERTPDVKGIIQNSTLRREK